MTDVDGDAPNGEPPGEDGGEPDRPWLDELDDEFRLEDLDEDREDPAPAWPDAADAPEEGDSGAGTAAGAETDEAPPADAEAGAPPPAPDELFTEEPGAGTVDGDGAEPGGEPARQEPTPADDFDLRALEDAVATLEDRGEDAPAGGRGAAATAEAPGQPDAEAPAPEETPAPEPADQERADGEASPGPDAEIPGTVPEEAPEEAAELQQGRIDPSNFTAGGGQVGENGGAGLLSRLFGR